MLRQRVITALVLLGLLLPALFADSALPFEWFTLLLISAAGWEWARLNGVQAPLPALAQPAPPPPQPTITLTLMELDGLIQSLADAPARHVLPALNLLLEKRQRATAPAELKAD